MDKSEQGEGFNFFFLMAFVAVTAADSLQDTVSEILFPLRFSVLQKSPQLLIFAFFTLRWKQKKQKVSLSSTFTVLLQGRINISQHSCRA